MRTLKFNQKMREETDRRGLYKKIFVTALFFLAISVMGSSLVSGAFGDLITWIDPTSTAGQTFNGTVKFFSVNFTDGFQKNFTNATFYIGNVFACVSSGHNNGTKFNCTGSTAVVGDGSSTINVTFIHYEGSTATTNSTTFTATIDNTAPTCTFFTVPQNFDPVRLNYDARGNVEAQGIDHISVSLLTPRTSSFANDTFTSIATAVGSFDRADTNGEEGDFTIKLIITDNAKQTCSNSLTVQGDSEVINAPAKKIGPTSGIGGVDRNIMMGFLALMGIILIAILAVWWSTRKN